MGNASGLGLTKEVVWNRRYKAWRIWFCAFFIVAVVCAFKENAPLFQAFALWSTLGLAALIGGLSATDIMKIRNGNGGGAQ